MGFQFLIGSLKSMGLSLLEAAAVLFQFLIGSLKSGRGRRPEEAGDVVSIPHR